MNPSTAFARVVVDELIRCGAADAVLSPGSRSAPLALALAAAEAAGRLRLHVRVDERSAGFCALGLAKASGRPVPVVCTSGSAVANLAPAVVEAWQAGVPLLLLTADRPPELRGAGANQTVDQVKPFGPWVRWSAEAGVPEERPGQVAYWRALVCRAWAAAGGGAWAQGAGPVHLNLPLREPLVPDGGPGWSEPLDGRPGGLPWTRVGPVDAARTAPLPDDLDVDRGVVLVGDLPVGARAAARAFAASTGWPVLTEPTGIPGPGALPHAPLLLGDEGFAAAHAPDVAVVLGRPGLSRAVLALLRRARAVAVAGPGGPDGWADPLRLASVVLPGIPSPGRPAPAGAAGPAGPGGLPVPAGAPSPARDPSPAGARSPARAAWTAQWQAASAAVSAAVDAVLGAPGTPGAGPLTGPAAARAVAAATPADGLLLAAASWPVRHIEATASRWGPGLGPAIGPDPAPEPHPWPGPAPGAADGGGLPEATRSTPEAPGSPAGPLVVGNRGASGIDGLVSTAWGAALAHQRAGGGRALALLGDLAFLHDSNGLLAPPGEARPDLTLVVVDNDGGGIFSQLEQAGPEHAASFERVFGTPHGLDVAAVAAAAGVPVLAVDDPGHLDRVLRAPGAGVRVVVARVGARADEAALLRRLQAAASSALRGQWAPGG